MPVHLGYRKPASEASEEYSSPTWPAGHERNFSHSTGGFGF